MNAIVYTSNSGYTEQYAMMLGEKTALPVFNLKNAKSLAAGSDIIYLGWLMAGTVKGLGKAKKRYNVKAVCAVGMSPDDSQKSDIESTSKIDAPIFVLQGGFDIKKLHGVYKFMMTMMAKSVGKKLAEKPDKTPGEEDMFDLMVNGGSRVSEERLAPVLEWYEANK